MPSGNSITGLRIPTTPGSRNDGDESTGIPAGIAHGDAARTVARMWRHLRHQESAPIHEPSAQAAIRRRGTMWLLCEAAAAPAAAKLGVCGNGWAICFIAAASAGLFIGGAATGR